MKKKLATLLMTLIMLCTCIFTGCDLVQTNMAAYFSKTIATIEYEDKTVKIDMKEYINALNNYGANLMQQNSYTYDQAVDATVTALINRKVMLEEAKKLVTLNDNDKNNIWNDTYDALVTNLSTFETEIRKDWDMTIESVSETEEESTGIVYKAYEPKAYVDYVDGKYVIKVYNETTENEDVVAKTNDAMYDAIVERYTTNGTRLAKESLKRYIKQLKANEDGQKLSTDDESVFKREITRIYTNLEETLYLTKLQNYYQYGNANGANGDYISNITVEEVLEKYKTMALRSKTLYEANKTTYNTNMLESFDSLNYVVDNNYFFVSHILMKFTDEQQKVYDSLQTKLANGELTPAQYNTQLNNLYNTVRAITRDEDGNVIENTSMNANTLLTNLQTALNAIQGENVEERKAEVFKEFMYKHNEDEGIMNANYLYVIGKNDSKMVESFTEASRQLNEDGQYGNISGLVRSNYGIHIVFYAGQVTNPITIPENTDFNLSNEDILKLTQTKLNDLNNKTLFDKIYELLVKDNYSSFETKQIKVLKQNLNITKYVSNYKK